MAGGPYLRQWAAWRRLPQANPNPHPNPDPAQVYHASSWASTQQLSELFRQGVATNDLRHIGLTVHCFDDTEVTLTPNPGPNPNPKT